MKLGALLGVIFFTGCGSGLQGLDSNNGNSEIMLELIAVFSGTVPTTTFSDTPGSSFPPNGFAAISSTAFSDLSNESSSTQYIFTSTSACSGGGGPFEGIDFVFDVGSVNLGSLSNMQILINSAAAGQASTSGTEPMSGTGTVAVFDGNGSGGWVQPSNTGAVPNTNASLSFSLTGPFGGWAQAIAGGPGSGQYLVVSFRSDNCASGQFSSVSLENIQLSLQ